MAVVLLIVAAVEALVPVPRESDSGPAGALAEPVAAPPVRTLELRYPAVRGPRRVRVATGSHVVVEVAATRPGQAGIPGLGLVADADPATPARFDVLAARPGTYGVSFQPASGGSALVGRLVVASRG